MSRLLPILLVAIPLRVSAQATSLVGFAVDSDSVNLAQCEADETRTFSWTLDLPPDSQDLHFFTFDSSSCEEANPLGSISQGAAGDGSEELRVRSDFGITDCSAVPEDKKYYVCARLDPNDSQPNPLDSFAVTFDTVAPGPPSTVTAQGGDGNVQVSWSYGDTSEPQDLGGFRVAFRVSGSTTPSYTGELGEAVFDTRIDGLTDGTQYEVWVEAKDDFGNWGEASAIATATPVPSDDFWTHYQKSDGEAMGCSSAGGADALWGLLVLVPLALRRRRGLAAMAAMAILVSVAMPADAQWTDPDRSWYFEFTLGPYVPDVDSEFDDSTRDADTPYADVFGSQTELLGRARLERTIWQGVGQFGVGFGLGYSQAVGKGVLLDNTPSADTTVFNWIPLEFTATYRLDYAALEWNVPLVPFTRIGFIYDLWWITDGTGAIVRSGGRTGYLYTAGLQLLLDIIDPRLAKDFQRSSGVDNSYLVFEITRLNIDGFGSPGFILSDTTWFAGLAIEF